MARIAGNFINTDILASIEYACAVAQSPLVIVLGHEGCGAVSSACDGVKLGHITEMLQAIKPAIEDAQKHQMSHLIPQTHHILLLLLNLMCC